MSKKKKLDRDEILRQDPGKQNITSVRGSRDKKRREKQSKEEKARIKLQKKLERQKKRELRRERRRAEKLRRKEEKLRMIPVLYDPEKIEGFKRSTFFGFALRYFSIAFSVFGVCYMFCDAFCMTPSTSATGEGVSGILLLLFCYAMTCAFSMVFMGKLYSLIGLCVLLFTSLMIFIFAGNPVSFFVGGFEEAFNSVMYILEDSGYAAAGYLSFGFEYLGSESVMLFGGIATVATVLCLIFSAFSARRTRLFPMVIVGGAFCAICFSYNFSNSNLGIAFTLAGLCSTIVLSAHDRLYAKLKKNQKSRAFSGYASAVAGLLALVIAIIPAVSTKSAFAEIGFISDPIEVARAYFMTILTGGNPKNNMMNSLVEEKPVVIDPPEFTNAHLFRVTSGSSQNIYLRSWIADDYDYATDAWSLLNEEDFAAMTEELKGSYAGKNFTGDEVAYRLYEMFNYKLRFEKDSISTSYFANENYVKNNDFGYVATYIDVEYIENSGILYVLPQSFITDLHVLEFESTYEPYSEKVELFSDGMYQSTWLNLFKKYSTGAILQSYTSAGYADNSYALIRYYFALGDFILNDLKNYSGNDQAALEAFDQKLIALDLYNEHIAEGILEEYLALPNDQQLKWYRRYYTTVEAYTEHVKDKYLKKSGSPVVEQIAEELSEEFDSYDNPHWKIMTVINYLNENYNYSLEPQAPSGEYASDLDAFLVETKEGYCVQFASAAALLLRELGIPARYVQGYIAADYEKSKDESGNSQFIFDVYDDNAHAWVEVYIEGLGWRTFETTPGYYADMYYVPQSIRPDDPTTTDPVQTTPPVTTPEDTSTTEPIVDPGDPIVDPNDPIDEPKFEIDWEAVGKLLAVVAVFLLVFFVVRRQIKIAHRIHDNRKYFIQRAIYGSFEDRSDMDLVAVTVGDCIYDVLYVAGYERRLGEMPSEFASRLDNEPEPEKKSAKKLWRRRRRLSRSMEEISALICKQEFGNGVTREELDVLGSYLDERLKMEYRALSPVKKIWYRYFKFMI